MQFSLQNMVQFFIALFLYYQFSLFPTVPATNLLAFPPILPKYSGIFLQLVCYDWKQHRDIQAFHLVAIPQFFTTLSSLSEWCISWQ